MRRVAAAGTGLSRSTWRFDAALRKSVSTRHFLKEFPSRREHEAPRPCAGRPPRPVQESYVRHRDDYVRAAHLEPATAPTQRYVT